jgi:3-hydroxyacyl-CoA dehydrogenase
MSPMEYLKNCKNDEAKSAFATTEYVKKMVENKWFGDKSKQGFYKKTKNEKGETEILSLNLKTLEYATQKKKQICYFRIDQVN